MCEKSQGQEEIEITEAMLEAGAIALLGHHPEDGADEDFARAVYLAMERARRHDLEAPRTHGLNP